ncbi:hypothetical protein DAPPUDRAFT_94544 [Daphnia pulex]|uniref:Uncharacterized protein n=1 Tax=Daphnia pulex TaxID=6669 RepID=E9FSC1_DAPPU|nr:hypothetical protein DAPPUDRAFT_303582 [Daphnia pulex]EFX89183.1 hypothetical protein DAPPUDRAFT_94544 [Daphnia pulex]|eukprot:EFX65541.1 hypothetical protein DAPPUDRAFT_303582 [Daphnia pulex]
MSAKKVNTQQFPEPKVLREKNNFQNKSKQSKRSGAGGELRNPSPAPISPQVATQTHSADPVSPSTKDEIEKQSTAVWHGPNCPSCEDLASITKENMGRLQHHFKFGSIYSIYFRIMMALHTIIIASPNSNDYKKDSNIFYPKQAKDLCELSASSEIISKNQPELFKEAAKLSNELLGPTKSDKFNCDRYEDYLELLLKISQTIGADKDLVGDIDTYLKPFRPEPIGDGSIAMGESELGNDPRKWQETFLDLKHSPEDENFGYELKKIAEPRRNKASFELIPTGYVFKCHGLSTNAN